MLEHAQFIVGNSSAGIREAPFYGVPTVNVGTRQNGRTSNEYIIHTGYQKRDVLAGIEKAMNTKVPKVSLFGSGDSNKKFSEIISSNSFWQIPKQKIFADNFL